MTESRRPLDLVGPTSAAEVDHAAIQAALAVESRIARGEEELIPASVVNRLVDGEPPCVSGASTAISRRPPSPAPRASTGTTSPRSRRAAATAPFTPCASLPTPSESPWTT